MNKPLPPYTCTCSPNIPELLLGLNISLILSTYQAGKVIFLSATEDDKLIQLPRNFDTPMGIALAGNNLAIASKNVNKCAKINNAAPPNEVVIGDHLCRLMKKIKGYDFSRIKDNPICDEQGYTVYQVSRK